VQELDWRRQLEHRMLRQANDNPEQETEVLKAGLGPAHRNVTKE